MRARRAETLVVGRDHDVALRHDLPDRRQQRHHVGAARRCALVGDAVGAVRPADHRATAGGRGVGRRDHDARHRDVGTVERLRVVEDLPRLRTRDRLERRAPDELARRGRRGAGPAACRTRGRWAPCAATPWARRRAAPRRTRSRRSRPARSRASPSDARGGTPPLLVCPVPSTERPFTKEMPSACPAPAGAPNLCPDRPNRHVEACILTPRWTRLAHPAPASTVRTPMRRVRTVVDPVRGQGSNSYHSGSSGRFRGCSRTRSRSIATWPGRPGGPASCRTGPGSCSSTGRSPTATAPRSLTLSDTPWVPAVVVAVLAAAVAPRLPRLAARRALRRRRWRGSCAAGGRRGSWSMRRELQRVAPGAAARRRLRGPRTGRGHALGRRRARQHRRRRSRSSHCCPASGDARRDAARERLYVRRLGFRRVSETDAGGQTVTVLVRG